VTITATPQPTATPPRIQVLVSVPADNIMTSVQVWRNDPTGRQLVRTQPSAGFESRLVIDYEAPYETALTYEWEANHYDPTASSIVYSEPWTTYPGEWTGDLDEAAIASNKLTVTGTPFIGGIDRTGLSTAWDSITLASLSGANNLESFQALFSGSTRITLSSTNTGYIQIVLGFSIAPIITDVPADVPFTVRRTTTGYVIEGSAAGSHVRTQALGSTFVGLRIIGVSSPPTIVGAITVETAPAATLLAETSAPVTLSPAAAWIIAPQAPALSIPITPDFDVLLAQVVALSPIDNADAKTYHRVLGTGRPVTSSSGPQGSDTLALTLYVHTRDQELALLALAEPQVPVLIRFPPSFGYGFTSDFYAIGDLTRARLVQIPNDPARYVTLPLVAVEAPDVDVQNAGWSWAAVLTTYPTWSAVRNAYATWADLAADNRIGA